MDHPKSHSRKLLFLCLALVFVLLAGFGGYAIGKSAPPVEMEAETVPTEETVPDTALAQCLNISVVADSEAYSKFTAEELNGNFNWDLRYDELKDVNIELDGVSWKLEEALREGAITEEEIFCYARTDARNGFCEETSESKHGLTHFTYRYPEYCLRLIYDIYETPDGQQHLISDMCVYDPSINLGPYTDFRGENGQRIELEDWGLDLELMESSPAGVIIRCSQSGGQQIGNLKLVSYGLIDKTTGKYLVPDVAPSEQTNLCRCDIPVLMGDTTEFTIDWTEYLGELPSGKYTMQIHIFDKFDESEVHPLMQDYQDWQVFLLDIDIP